MLDLRVLSVKKLWAVVTVGAVLLTASCKKEDAGKLPEVSRGNPQQVILTVNGISVTEDQTDGKLGAYLLYNPYADEEQIRGARKSIAHSIAESILIDEMLKKQGLAPDEKEIEQAGRYLEFFYKDAGWVKKNAEYKNISEEEMYRDNLLEYKKMKLLAAQKDTDKPSAEELNRFLSENRELYAEKPERKTTYQILVRYGNGNSSSSEKAKKKQRTKPVTNFVKEKIFGRLPENIRIWIPTNRRPFWVLSGKSVRITEIGLPKWFGR